MPPTTELTRAIGIADIAHRGQTRKGTTIPYLSHLLSVSALVMEHGGDEPQAIAGVLHDLVEDTDWTVAAVRAEFGDRVADIVDGCTDTVEGADDDRDGTIDEWLVRKQRYLDHLAEVAPDAALVSGCDKLHNARAIVADLRRDGPATLGRFTGRRLGTLWYYGGIVRGLTPALTSLGAGGASLADELTRTVHEMAELAERDLPHEAPTAEAIDADLDRVPTS